MTISWRELNRREFIRIASMAAGMFSIPACSDDETQPAPDSATDAALDVATDPVDDGMDTADAAQDVTDAGDMGSQAGSDLPSLGGAPNTPEGITIAAFVDTIVPGSHRDPTGAPGALDVGAAAFFFDPELPALQLVPLMTLILDNQAQGLYPGRVFAELTPIEREETVTRLLETAQELAYAVLLAKIAYFSSEGAGEHLGYPGANMGYYLDENFTFGRPMATEITSDGNYP